MSSERVAIVTGSSRGIGAAIAKRLAKDGFAVVVNYVSSAAEGEAVVAAIKSAGGKAVALQADVADPEAAGRLFEGAVKSFGGVDVLVNTAGVMASNRPMLADTDDATFERIMSTNVRGSFNTMRLAAKQLRTGGRIINFSTSVIGLALPGYAVYAASKSAVETLTNIMAKELRGKGITVNAVAPGPTATELFTKGKSEQEIAQMAKMAPLERLGTPEDIAGAVAFLAGPDGAWVNGQTLRANGGIV